MRLFGACVCREQDAWIVIENKMHGLQSRLILREGVHVYISRDTTTRHVTGVELVKRTDYTRYARLEYDGKSRTTDSPFRCGMA